MAKGVQKRPAPPKPVETVQGNHKYTLDLGTLTPKQREFMESTAKYTAYGGARGGGKTHAVRIKAIGAAAWRYPGIRILIMRRTYPELESNHIAPILKLVPQSLASYHGTNRIMYFHNGSIIKFGNYSKATAAMEYQGQEYDWIFIDEATQFTEDEFRTLGGVMRGTSGIPNRCYITCNPGGVGHRWVKRLFIERAFKTDSENEEENEDPDDYVFIPARLEDNPYLAKTGYAKQLATLPENMRKAHRYGDWDALAGTYFPELKDETHVVSVPFTIPPHWTRYRAIDYGLDMLACGWFAVDENGRVYMYREVKQSGLVVSEAAQVIRDATLPGEPITITFAPPDLWSRQKDTGKTMAELFSASGVSLVRADNARVQGWLQVKELLTMQPDGKPGMMFFPECGGTLDDMKAIQADDRNPNDCAKDPHDVTHTCDMVRYFCVSRTIKGGDTATDDGRGWRVGIDSDADDDDETSMDYDFAMVGGHVSDSYLMY